MKLKTILIDDEQHCLDTLTYDLEKHCSDTVEILGTAGNAIEATGQINKVRPDLIFLDIELPGMNGIEFLESIGELEAKLVFTTAYSHYALDGYRFKASGYLLKPIDKDELVKVVSEIHLEKQKADTVLKGKLSVKDSKGTEFIEFGSIRLCEASNNYTVLHLSDGTTKTVSKTLKTVLSELPEKDFIRIHQSYAINLKYLKKYLHEDGGTVQLDNDKKYRLSKGYRETFLAMME